MPHDSYFGHMMEIKSVAKSFFMSQLPQAINEALDWDTLKIDESARRNPGKKTKYTDISYTCNLKKEGIPIYLHCEQERSDRIPETVARLLGYNVGVISRHRRQGNKKLPIIINFVLYNNPKASSESYPKNSLACSEAPWLEQLLHGEYFILLNVKQASEEILASYGHSGIMSLLLKRAEEHNFIEWLKSYGHLIKDIVLNDIGLNEVFELSFSYVVTVARDKSKELLDTFKALFPQYEEKIMTVARQLKREGEKIGEIKGVKKGEVKGKIEGKREGEMREKKAIAQKMLSTNYSIEEIARLTNLSKEEISLLGK
jgi:predicted transposase/invertase (TIGR01784 family)